MTAALALNCSQTLDIVVYQKRFITVQYPSAKDMPTGLINSKHSKKAPIKNKNKHITNCFI